jgi:diguanylate cyclase (GGDEF)-like protein
MLMNQLSKGEQDREQLLKRVRALEEQIDRLEDHLIHDKLTGLKTRAFFEEEVGVYLDVIEKQAELQKSGASERKERFGFRNLSVIFFDIDHFKSVNDNHGHDAGDVVLREVAQVIEKSLRAGDTVARWGGEEIVVSLLGADEQDASAKAEEIRDLVSKHKFSEVPSLKITVSAGVCAAERGLSVHKLVKRADLALYEAKESGRNKVIAYSEMMKLNPPVLTAQI